MWIVMPVLTFSRYTNLILGRTAKSTLLSYVNVQAFIGINANRGRGRKKRKEKERGGKKKEID
jgi:hypothetical protein